MTEVTEKVVLKAHVLSIKITFVLSEGCEETICSETEGERMKPENEQGSTEAANHL